MTISGGCPARKERDMGDRILGRDAPRLTGWPSDTGKTAREIATEIFPGKPDDFLEFVIWEKTGFPSFWNIPGDGATPEECFRKQLVEFRDGKGEGNEM